MNYCEKELIGKAKQGDVEAFEKLIEGCQKKVFNIAFRMLGNFDDASELSQEVFLKAYKSIKNFKGDSLFNTWIYKVTTNACLDEIRKRKNKKVVSLDEDIEIGGNEMKRQIKDDSPGPELTAEDNELKRAVKDSINMLSEEYRTVIVLRDIQGFSYEEISGIIKCPEGTVKSRINRARQALKKILQQKKELINEEYVK
ncbi:RNA polymerase sigma factor [Acetivibrio mesophilus]|uniref:Sigma-70 family RNA polymerase sigma factor n=1 Tax=Acetivibrio mesophilus TaxID=2487273 RepID=A0A4Q0I648_9FIRM|nr:sigma-70 family RNA polymerase sigma factor [Acetivibrio mesophilus]ODM25252.1 RNA polymerase subunit sigma-24 [Clostridium sp. Bc-iso-3]RXE59728.1 sigma-70 family RNA polymerase sigma factor [Acetivibrio mesophilus]HHV28550.1 sigma-70 family RNA polymerase sigma factor [Clostridium sp.]